MKGRLRIDGYEQRAEEMRKKTKWKKEVRKEKHFNGLKILPNFKPQMVTRSLVILALRFLLPLYGKTMGQPMPSFKLNSIQQIYVYEGMKLLAKNKEVKKKTKKKHINIFSISSFFILMTSIVATATIFAYSLVECVYTFIYVVRQETLKKMRNPPLD